MEEKRNIFDNIRQFFTIYGVMVLVFVVFSMIIGDEAKDISTLFTLGSQGLLSATLLQLLLMALIITIAQNIFLTDILIKNLALKVRNILFFVTILIAIIAFVIICGWFPINDPGAWIGFLVSFVVCTGLSAFLMRLEENAENKKMQEALNKLKK